MFYKTIFFLFFFSFSLNSAELFNEDLYNNDLNDLLLNDNQKEFNIQNIEQLYKDFQSATFKTNISEEPLMVVFNQNFENVEISMNNKIYLSKKNNKNKNFFLAPNIINLSSMHNKSFSHSLYLEGFYDGLVKKHSQHILFFHELGHFYLHHHVDYLSIYNQQQLNEKGSYLKQSFDESFSDLFGLVLLVKYFDIEKEKVKELFKSLSFYRKKYFNFKYKGSNSIDLFYKDFMINFDDIMEKSDIEIGHYLFNLNKNFIDY